MQNLIKNQNKIFSHVNKHIKKHPYFCVIILHEYFRNIFPYDPVIKFKIDNPKKRINLLQKSLINLFKSLESFGSYKINFKNFENKTELKKKTGKVYGKFWGTFSRKENHLAKKFIQERFKNFKSFKKDFFKNKKIIDVGCGGGRYSNALKLLKAKSVMGFYIFVSMIYIFFTFLSQVSPDIVDPRQKLTYGYQLFGGQF